MRKAIPSHLEYEATSDPPHTMADASTIVLDNPNSQEKHALKPGEGGDKPASAESHPPSGNMSLPYTSHSNTERINIGFDCGFESDSNATTNMMVLGKSTDGSLRLYQSSYPNGTDIDKASPAQQEWAQEKACHDDLDAVLDPFRKKIGPPKHAGLAEQVHRRGLWAGP